MAVLPADTHVHSEFSWDTGGPSSPSAVGTMRRTCGRAVRIGLPVVIFTEHLDVDGYLDSIDRCRHEFTDLRILTGVEFGQPHLDRRVADAVIDLSVPRSRTRSR